MGPQRVCRVIRGDFPAACAEHFPATRAAHPHHISLFFPFLTEWSIELAAATGAGKAKTGQPRLATTRVHAIDAVFSGIFLCEVCNSHFPFAAPPAHQKMVCTRAAFRNARGPAPTTSRTHAQPRSQIPALDSHGKSERSRAPILGALVDPIYRSTCRPTISIAVDLAFSERRPTFNFHSAGRPSILHRSISLSWRLRIFHNKLLRN